MLVSVAVSGTGVPMAIIVFVLRAKVEELVGTKVCHHIVSGARETRGEIKRNERQNNATAPSVDEGSFL